jgi:hypothetical protein
MATTKVTANVLADNSVTQAKLADDAVGADELAASAVVTASIVDDAVTAAKLAANAVVNASIASGAAIDMDKLDGDSLANAITDFAQDDLVILSDTSDSGNLVKITTSNFEDAIFGNISGDATVAAGGALTIANNAVETAMINADAVTGAKIADDAIDSEHYTDGSIDTAHLADGAITAAKIADGTVVAAEIADNAVTTAKINADAVTGAKIADDAINSEHYTDGSIDTAHIADDQVTHAKLEARYTAKATSTSTGNQNLDASTATTFLLTGNVGTATLTIQNMKLGQAIDIVLSGTLSSAAITLATNFSSATIRKVGTTELDTSATNVITAVCIDDNDSAALVHYTINTFATDTTP